MVNLICNPSTFLIILVPTILSFNCVLNVQSFGSLYDHSDENILTLDWANFTTTIEDQSNVFIVQFYKHWCPYCKRFAPIWKKLAEDIKLWRSVVRLAVINCAHEENVATCRAAAIPFVPTIHFYPSNWNFSSKLSPIVIKKGTVEALRENITTLLAYTSPTLSAAFNYTDPIDIRPLHQKSLSKKIFLVAEKNNSKTGTEVILDNYQFIDQVTIKRVNWQSPWLHQLQLNESRLPALITLPKRGFVPILVNTNKSMLNSRKAIDEIILDSIGLSNKSNSSFIESSTRSPLNVSGFIATYENQLYIDDLYKCLQQILTNEILIYDNYQLDKINSLKNFTNVIGNYFPFRNFSRGKAFFNNLSDSLGSYERQLSVNNSSHSIPVTQLIAEINRLQKIHPLPKPNHWITCRGSSPIYRGYTCSLWLLWHTLSVNEYAKVNGQLTNHQVAFAMRSFIRDFFSCEECRQHFINETANIDSMIDQSDSSSSIRYLWSVHNSVNKRIAGDATEDPYFPKVQFPTPNQCSTCWTRGQFNENRVTDYLLNRYNASNWINYANNQ